MFIIERNWDGDKRYFTNRRTWTSDPENAQEFRTDEQAWSAVNKIPGRLSYNEYHLDSDYSLVQV